jgi:hypothetical protein
MWVEQLDSPESMVLKPRRVNGTWGLAAASVEVPSREVQGSGPLKAITSSNGMSLTVEAAKS